MEKTDFFQKLKTTFTEVHICRDSGIVVVNSNADPVYVKKIRMWNLFEAFIVYGLVLLIVWLSMLDTSLWWMWAGLGGLLIWTFFLTPLVHYKYEKDIFLTEEQKARGIWFYFFECRGLGSPRRYFFNVDGDGPQIKTHFKTIIGIVIFMDLLFVSAVITFDPQITQILGVSDLLTKILLEIALIALIDVALIFIAFPVMLRLDNFNPSIKYMIVFILISIPLLFFFSLFFIITEPAIRPALESYNYFNLRGDTAIVRFLSLDIFAIGGQWAGYVFWGFLQQLLFLGVFNTYFARGFDIENKKQRLYACLCSATFFGLIHLPNFWLSIFTFISGFFWALYFMQERNLMAMGIIHGFGGTIANKLFPINFSVGPSQVA